jgi:hypothetical protein
MARRRIDGGLESGVRVEVLEYPVKSSFERFIAAHPLSNEAEDGH